IHDAVCCHGAGAQSRCRLGCIRKDPLCGAPCASRSLSVSLVVSAVSYVIQPERLAKNLRGESEISKFSLGCDSVPSRKVLRINVGLVGFEPTASWSRTRRSTKLSHSPKWIKHATMPNRRARYFAYVAADSKEIEPGRV